MRIAVAGADGFVGSNLIPYLDSKGHEVVALDLNEYEGPAESHAIDLTDYESFAGHLEDVDAVYYLVHSMSQSGDFTELEKTCAKNFQRACSEHGVDRIFFIGGIVHHDKTSEHLMSRTRVGEILRESDADVTEFRAAIILGEESSSYQIMYQLVTKLPIMIGPRWLTSRCQPIHIDDVLHYLEASLHHDKTRGETYEIGGGSVHTYADLLKILGRECGREPYIFTAPFLTPRLSSLWVELVTDYPSTLIRALIESLKDDMVVEDDAIDDIIPQDCKDYREAVRAILDDG